MNIFYINTDPLTAARELADDHIRKMQIESAQMCCTTHWAIGNEAPYKKAHFNHPSTKWVRESIQHYRWLVQHGLEICNEFVKRYGKRHKTQDVLEWCRDNEPTIPYKKFYIKDKVNIKGLRWNKLGNMPEWIFIDIL